ncbi:hypothetical protein OUQ99_19430 [Streptomonospora nanhaiensis]|uniref:Uncharacterized protein n=1 Tax=Streptomonospora nanhaiensis TaxID=1323731 RepID=A0ABY6YGQ6_9ACTN|nr:hypothetical protein [Streptomonospora nanhaiensis]WAE71403.1 hypothetical protein OUQ99_19430 [Streptomonospora nanhaiensis]
MPKSAVSGPAAGKGTPVDVAAPRKELRRRADGEARCDAGVCSTDASDRRRVPLGAMVRGDAGAAAKAVSVGARFGASILSRGGGTGSGGQDTGAPVVPDWTRRRAGPASGGEPEASLPAAVPGAAAGARYRARRRA